MFKDSPNVAQAAAKHVSPLTVAIRYHTQLPSPFLSQLDPFHDTYTTPQLLPRSPLQRALTHPPFPLTSSQEDRTNSILSSQSPLPFPTLKSPTISTRVSNQIINPTEPTAQTAPDVEE